MEASPCPICSTFDFPGNRLFVLVFGLALLLAGRRIFWLVVGVVGFLFGFDLASRVLGLDAEGLGLLIGVFAGVLGIFLAVFLQKFAIGLRRFPDRRLPRPHPAPGRPREPLGRPTCCAFLSAAWSARCSRSGCSRSRSSCSPRSPAPRWSTQSLALDPGATTLAFAALAVVGIAVQAGIGPKKRRRAVRSDD